MYDVQGIRLHKTHQNEAFESYQIAEEGFTLWRLYRNLLNLIIIVAMQRYTKGPYCISEPGHAPCMSEVRYNFLSFGARKFFLSYPEIPHPPTHFPPTSQSGSKQGFRDKKNLLEASHVPRFQAGKKGQRN